MVIAQIPDGLYYWAATLDDGAHPGQLAARQCHTHVASRAPWEPLDGELPRHDGIPRLVLGSVALDVCCRCSPVDLLIARTYANRMDITVNGSVQRTDADITVAGLIALLELGDTRLAIEVNEDVVPRSQYRNFVLACGDRVEIVQAIGGG